jgi:hypothetical protein
MEIKSHFLAKGFEIDAYLKRQQTLINRYQGKKELDRKFCDVK